ncbi:ABC transporter permease [Myroides sp. M-43]|uniref:ABC transporter permease n=1 Tax=Myroides oncorhynchi TaxID=2893756 RepID=UPI001E2F0D0B|nr:ABC transporter permease [Myroides oncorhynchi]MCC9041908.1 ABC transporter permease [Myroides oncorhynchi]
MLKNWLKIYWYNTMKHKMYFLLTVVGLAIGIASVVLASLYYLEEASYDQWNPNKNEVYVVESRGNTAVNCSQPFGLGNILKDNYEDVEAYMYYNGVYHTADVEVVNTQYNIEKVLYAQKNFFEFFPFELIYGSKDSAFKNPNDIVIDLLTSEMLFGKNSNPLGKEVKIQDERYTISAVYRIGDNRSSISPQIVVDKISKQEEEYKNDWFNSNFNLLIKTKNKDKTEEDVNSLFTKNFYAVIAQSKGVSVQNLIEKDFKEFYSKQYLRSLNGTRMTSAEYVFPEGITNMLMLRVIIGLSVMLLLLSVFNYINLSLSISLNRTKEVGIRKTVGASRVDIIQQSLFESLLTTGLAVLISIILVELMVPFINTFVGTTIDFSLIKFALLLIALLIGVVLLTGYLPALYLSKQNTLLVLKGLAVRSKGGQVIKNVFLIVQFIIASFFIVSGITVYKQVDFMMNKDLGFKGEQIIGLLFLEEERYESSDNRLNKYFNFKEELKKLEGVEEVSTASSHYGSGALSNIFTYCTYKEEQFLVEQVSMDYNYFDMYQIKIQSGRNISIDIASDSISNVVVNEAFARAMKEPEPIGKYLDISDFKYTIIGVVKDYNNDKLDNAIKPKIYTHFNTNQRVKRNFVYVSVKLNKANIEKTLVAIEKVWKKYNIESKIPFTYDFVDKRYAKTFNRILLEKKVFSILNYIVVFIALFGLFAVSSFTIGTKLREVAIRKVLGAETSGLLRQLSFQYIIYCIIGFGIAVFPSYYFLNKWLENYAYRIEIDWSVYVYSLLLILGLTLLIVISRAYKATRVDVLKYIKYE